MDDAEQKQRHRAIAILISFVVFQVFLITVAIVKWLSR